MEPEGGEVGKYSGSCDFQGLLGIGLLWGPEKTPVSVHLSRIVPLGAGYSPIWESFVKLIWLWYVEQKIIVSSLLSLFFIYLTFGAVFERAKITWTSTSQP